MKDMLRFADRFDALLLGLGALGATAVGVTMPLFSVVFGEMINFLYVPPLLCCACFLIVAIALGVFGSCKRSCKLYCGGLILTLMLWRTLTPFVGMIQLKHQTRCSRCPFGL